MAETRRKFDEDFKEGAVRLVRETGRPIAQVARELGINDGTLGNWMNRDRRRAGDGAVSADERAELSRLICVECAGSGGTYGSPRITAGLRRSGWRVSRNTVARLMFAQHLVAR